MKKIGLVLIALTLAGCQASDEEIRADIAGKAQQDLNFAGLYYTVNNGIVSFTGRCPSQKAFAKLKQTVQNIHVIKAVSYQVYVAPVVLDTLTNIKLQADSILAKYPQVIAEVGATGITLKGEVAAAEKDKLIDALGTLNFNVVKDSLILR